MAIFSLKGKIALITGGGSGIGKAIATTFAEQGASVHILENDINAADIAVKEIHQLGLTVTAHNVDVSIYNQVYSLVKSIGVIGPIDLLINNAGIPDAQWAIKQSDELIDNVIGTNLTGPYLLSIEVAKRLIEKGIKDVAFDKGGYKYHGLIKILADSAREEGLNF